jgi:hypothetical protein
LLSCPAADELAIAFKEYPMDVYFLGYHVDYWNYIGWQDKFSNDLNGKRKYAAEFKQ